MRYTNLQEDGTDEEEIELVLAASSNGDARVPTQRTDAYQHVDNVLEQSYVAAQRQQNWYVSTNGSGVSLGVAVPLDQTLL